MRQDEMARPHARAAEIEAIGERSAEAERPLWEDKRDEVAIEQVRALRACLERAESLAEWERNAAGPVPCMRVAPWKGSGYDGD
ncbi:MAG TPA: hypothetical protein VHR15_15615 [Ktedonobacterales bacterium]|jgi:hypothetical protein|nr:hypothetical protein [Ktedonobacterales bacterium]